MYYKLGEYAKAVESYESVLASNASAEEPLDADEITDIITNYLACQSQSAQSIGQVEDLLKKYS